MCCCNAVHSVLIPRCLDVGHATSRAQVVCSPPGPAVAIRVRMSTRSHPSKPTCRDDLRYDPASGYKRVTAAAVCRPDGRWRHGRQLLRARRRHRAGAAVVPAAAAADERHLDVVAVCGGGRRADCVGAEAARAAGDAGAGASGDREHGAGGPHVASGHARVWPGPHAGVPPPQRTLSHTVR